MKRKLLTIFLILLLLFVLAYYYINAVFLPLQLKQIITDKAQDFLHRKLTVKEITYNPLKGIVITDLTIFRQDDPQLPFVHFDEAHFNVLLPAVLKNKQIVIPSVVVEKPYVHIVQDQHRVWSFADLLQKRQASTARKSPFSVLVGGVHINQGKIQLTYPADGRIVTEVLEDINLKSKISLSQGIQFEFNTKFTDPASRIKINGHYNPVNKNADARLALQNINAGRYYRLFAFSDRFDLKEAFIEQADLRLQMKNQQPDVQGAMTLRADVDILTGLHKHIQGQFMLDDVHLFKQDGNLLVNLGLAARQANIDVADKYFIKGDMQAKEIAAIWDGDKLDLKGQLSAQNAGVTFPSERKLQGNLEAKTFEIIFRYPLFHLNGSFDIEHPVFTAAPDIHLQGKHFSVKDISFDRNDETISLTTGALGLSDAKLTANDQVTAEGQITAPQLTYTRKDQTAEINADIQLAQAQLTFPGAKTLTGTFTTQESALTLRDNGFNFIGTINGQAASFKLGDQQWQAIPQLHLTLQRSQGETLGGTSTLGYKAVLSLSEGSATGVPHLNELHNVSGQITFIPDEAQINLLKLTALNTPAELTGQVTNFKRPFVEMKASSSTADLKALGEFFAPYLEKYQIIPDGKAALRLSYTGAANAPADAKITVNAKLNNAGLSGKKLPAPLENISGDIYYTGDSVIWKDLALTFQKKRYFSAGEIRNFKNPLIKGDLSTNGIKLSADLEAVDRHVTIKAMTGILYNSPFTLTGEVQLKPDEAPWWNATGHIDLAVTDLSHINAAWEEKLKNIKPKGQLATDISYQGKLTDWPAAVITAVAKSDQLFLNNYRFSAVTMEFTQGKEDFGRFKLDTNFYDGGVAMTALTNPQNDGLSFQLTGQLQNLNLSKLRKDAPWKDREISGFVSADLKLGGLLANPGSFSGSGKITVEQGYLMEVELLKGLWGALSSTVLIPEMRAIPFTDASANFEIADKKVRTRDLTLQSQPMDVVFDGWVDFDQNVNFDVQAKVKETEILRSNALDIQKGATAILAGASDLFLIKVTGPLSKPNFSGLKPAAGKILERATGAVLDNVKSIFEEIMQPQ